MKRVLGILATLGIFAVLGWAGGYGYWHIRLVSAVRTLETRSGVQGGDADAVDLLEDAGCRALPYLIPAMQPGKNPFFLAEASQLLKKDLKGPLMRGDLELDARLEGWLMTPDMSPAERQRKCDEIHAWWREKGEARHSGAKWWKSDCGGI
ncbi:MAG TPA: hypothetical protein VE981_03300 [Planctomycetota bacterium]|nr:hypothetical protein [Planctomycetota bacterium]